MPKVSVIVPVYNVEKYLPECLDSIINQTFSDIEIICINDGSTDNSLKLLEKYALRDSRIKVITKENDGLGRARNTGLEHVTAKLVCFIDSDDYFTNDAIEKLYNAYQKTKADIIVAKAQLFKDITNEKIDVRGWSRKYKPAQEIFNRDECSEFLFQLISQMTHAKMFSVDFIKKYNLQFHKCRMHEDLTFVYSAIAFADTIYLLDEIIYMYRAFRVGSLVSLNRNKSDSWKDFSLAFNLLKANLVNNNLYDLLFYTYCNALIYIILGHLKNISFKNKIKLIFYVRKNYCFLKELKHNTYKNNKYYKLFKLIFWGVCF